MNDIILKLFDMIVSLFGKVESFIQSFYEGISAVSDIFASMFNVLIDLASKVLSVAASVISGIINFFGG